MKLLFCVFALLALLILAEPLNREEFLVPETENSESHAFQAEINRLMSIIINSLYSNKDIFLRELVSNAADALDKAKYVALTGDDENSDIPMEIRIFADEENKMLYITDTGIGMTKSELINNLGSIAKSGTKEFLEKVQTTGDVNQIGQFGVGFYSSFLVADTVTVISKSDGDDQYIWESSAESDTSFTVAKDPRGNTLKRGTQIILTLKDDATEYLQTDKLKELIMRYNEFMHYPLYIWTSKEVETEVPIEDDEESDEPAAESDSDFEVGDFEEEDDTPKTTTITETVTEWEKINNAEPLWRRPRSEITDEDYDNFYQNVLGDTQEALAHTHFRGEGEFEFTGLFYIPKMTPWGLYEANFESTLKLYVKRVFITDNFEEFMPRYLSFMKGLIDSDDLDLNVSREMLQKNRALKAIKKRIIRKVLALFKDLAEAEDQTQWDRFYSQYHQSLKLGVIDDSANKDRITQLLRFKSAKHPDELIGFDQYVEEMKSNQDNIYYLIGETQESLLASPLIERLIKKGYDVLLMTDPIDSYVMNQLRKYQGKFEFANVGKEGVDLGDDMEALNEEFSPLMTYLTLQLSSSVSKVQLSSRLTNTPAAIISSSFGYSADMERIMKAQALSDPRYASILAGKKILEINPRHPIVKKLNQLAADEETTEDTQDLVKVLYDTALLSSGYDLPEPTGLTSRINKMLAQSLGVENEQVEEFEEPEEPEATEDIFENLENQEVNHEDL